MTVDLFTLYNEVTRRGGCEKTTPHDWMDIAYTVMHLATISRVADRLEFIYRKYLRIYESVHFLGIAVHQPTREDIGTSHPYL